MACGCKKNKQVTPPEPAKVVLTEVSVKPVQPNQTVTDLTEEQKKQVDSILQKINQVN